MTPNMKKVDDAFVEAIKQVTAASSGNDAQLLELIRSMTKTILLLEERINMLEQFAKMVTEHIVAVVVADAMEGDDNGPVN